MSVEELPSGAWRARLMIDGRMCRESFPTRQQAEDWELVTRARAVTGALPDRVTVAEYAARWIAGYDTAPANTRTFHARNLPTITDALGAMQVGRVVPSGITRMLNNDVIDGRGVSAADRVYRTASALFGMAYADGLHPNGSPVRSKRHRPRRQPTAHVVHERPQARQMLLQLPGWQRDTALLQLAVGARFGEIAGLTPHDIDLAAGRITIRRRFSSHARSVRATKNHRFRVLDLPRMSRATLERQLREAGDRRRCRTWWIANGTPIRSGAVG